MIGMTWNLLEKWQHRHGFVFTTSRIDLLWTSLNLTNGHMLMKRMLQTIRTKMSTIDKDYGIQQKIQKTE